MAGTYSQMYIQVVFSVKGREQLLLEPWREKVFKYISGIITLNGQKSIIVNGVEDHIHAFIGLKPNMCVSDLVRDIKCESTKFIKREKFLEAPFSWQGGFGAFSYSHSHIERVYKYILNQKEHHRKRTFKDEYIGMLDKFEVPFEERFLFDWIDK